MNRPKCEAKSIKLIGGNKAKQRVWKGKENIDTRYFAFVLFE